MRYLNNENTPFRAYITNLGKYTEGNTVGEWVDLPTTRDKLQDTMKRIGIGDKRPDGTTYEEIFITDYDYNIPGLAQIVAELRAENKQAVPKKEWYIYSLMSAIPVVGFIFFAVRKKDKNENKKSFAKAGFTINLILSIVILLMVGSALYFAFGGKITMPKKTAKITEESIEETRLEESSSAARTTSQAVSSTAATSPVKKTEPVKSFSYDKNSKAFTFELNGNTFKYPVAAASIKDMGYIYVSNTLSSETATLDMYMDAYKSTVMIKYNTKAGNTSDCYAIAVELKEGSTFMGLSTAATYATVKEAFKDADTEVTSDYKSDTATGILQYMYGDRIISVTLDNGYVTGASIQ